MNVEVSPRQEYKFSRAIIILFLLGMVWRIFYHVFFSSDGYLDFLTDDFFYYLLPAKNFVTHGISSFDGITVTNGYHPLWMLCLSFLYWITIGNEQVFFAALSIICAFSSYLTFTFLWQLKENIFPAGRLVSLAVLILVVAASALIFVGMEITLTIPLYAYLLLRISRLDFYKPLHTRNILWLGFFSSLLILSRLDTGLLILLILILLPIFYNQVKKDLVQFYVYFCLGGFLVPLYFLFNYFWFGHFMTVSSVSKILKLGHAINFSAFIFLAFNRDGLGGMLLIPLGLTMLYITRKKISTSARFICFIVLSYPVLYYLAVLYGSDWALNRWYFYPLPFCFFIASGLFSNIHIPRLREPHGLLLYRIGFIVIAICILVFTVSFVLRDTVYFKVGTNSIYANAKRLLPFVQMHPGIYAMGDQAGLTAYILKVPLIQLEGLAADFTMNEHIKNQDNLMRVLQEYHINYLIETSDNTGLEKKNNCYLIEEPHSGQAGALSKKMNGAICSEPVYQQTSLNQYGYELQTYIFDMKKN